ncbi:MAG: N-formylglutamate amidohydrolase [Pelagimonas sp.]|nr:N-formylglutamate amidohydrolase [Pelagimonas sp.]
MHLPKGARASVVFASPHSGAFYPENMLQRSVLDDHLIRSSEDAFVDQLFDSAPEFGSAFLRAVFPRAYVDLNRAPDELDPALIAGVRASGHNPRVSSGLGVIPRVVSNGRAIYRGKLSKQEAEARIDQVWRPYHAQLRHLLDEARAAQGFAVLIDCHSMPHEALASVQRDRARRPQVVLGDRFGASAAPEIVDQIEAAFVDVGLRVARNAPFAGAFSTQYYGRPSRHQHAVQIEIDRSLYMDEAKIEPHAGFDDFREMLQQVTARIAAIGVEDQRLAAE